MPTKANVYDIAYRLGIAADRYKVSTDETDTITITFEKIAADLPTFTDKEVRDLYHQNTEYAESPEGGAYEKQVYDFLNRFPKSEHPKEKFRDLETLTKLKQKEKGMPLDHIVTPSPGMLIDKINGMTKNIQDALKYSPSFKRKYKGEVSSAEATQVIDTLKAIESKYNKILEESIITDLQMEIKPYAQKVNDWENILNNYYIEEQVIDPEDESTFLGVK